MVVMDVTSPCRRDSMIMSTLQILLLIFWNITIICHILILGRNNVEINEKKTPLIVKYANPFEPGSGDNRLAQPTLVVVKAGLTWLFIHRSIKNLISDSHIVQGYFTSKPPHYKTVWLWSRSYNTVFILTASYPLLDTSRHVWLLTASFQKLNLLSDRKVRHFR